ncbi:TadE/TadG family type IV pilus assembly protein [Thermincola potens]|uniref:TadE family protein n=1 Tax=Thermincola potens (strain JR) TaxID=635013 RepID=D5XAH4_THEPJ|nr:TadE family protein [Thermincola potens]ADG81273.1 TadE family protein [Thermincola potens JR]
MKRLRCVNLLRDERGSQALEFTALLPLVVFIILFLVQGAIAAYTMVVASATARDGARYYSVGHSVSEVESMVSNELAGIPLKKFNCGKDDKEVWVELTVAVPVLDIPVLEDFDIDLQPIRVTMPNTES